MAEPMGEDRYKSALEKDAMFNNLLTHINVETLPRRIPGPRRHEG